MATVNKAAHADVFSADAPSREVPLVVDVDRALVRTDLLVESLMLLVKRRPLRLLAAIHWLFEGMAVFKRELASEVMPEIDTLPLDPAFMEFLVTQKEEGRRLVLVTGADLQLANAIADHTGLFDKVISSDGVNHVAGRTKCDRLVSEFGEKGFDYAGDARRDKEVWTAARRGILVDAPDDLSQRMSEAFIVERTFTTRNNDLTAYWRALRPSQWIKNTLVFLPLLAVPGPPNTAAILDGVLAAAAFCLCASSGYLLNDLMDLPNDRHHPDKKHRPITSGRVSLGVMLTLVPSLFLAGLLLGIRLHPWVAALLVIYSALTLAYSWRLKDIVILDVIVLVVFYTLRVLAGAVVFSITVPVWLLTFCIFLFLSLGLVKRYAELVVMHTLEGAQAHARAYVLNDRDLLASLGAASGYLAGLFLVLFQGSADATGVVNMDFAGAALCLLFIYWISYVWLMAHRGRMKDDPVAFAISDKISLTLVLMAAAIVASRWLIHVGNLQ